MRQLLVAALVLTLGLSGTSFAGDEDPASYCFDGSDGAGDFEAKDFVSFDVDVLDDLTIGDLDVSFDLSHPDLGQELFITLANPDGFSIELFGGFVAKEADILLTYDDDGVPYLDDTLTCECAMQPAFGTLGFFNLNSTLGLWSCTVDASFALDGGTLNEYCLLVEEADELEGDVVACTEEPAFLPAETITGVDLDVLDDVTIGDCDVRMNLQHGFIDEFTMSLISPAETTVLLHETDDFEAGEKIALLYDDDGVDYGTDSFTCLCPMKPADSVGSMADYNGQSTLGLWTVEVDNSLSFTAGDLNEWCLRVDAASTHTRGDCNGDGRVIILTDMIFLLSWQLNDGSAPPCEDSCDVDGIDGIDAIPDALYGLTYQYMSGPAPVAPFPDCGIAETPTGNSCAESTCTPEAP